MNLTDAVSVLGAPAAVLLFMWLNRDKGSKQPGPDPVAQKLDALIEETRRGNAAMSDLGKSIAILLDRSER